MHIPHLLEIQADIRRRKLLPPGTLCIGDLLSHHFNADVIARWCDMGVYPLYLPAGESCLCDTHWPPGLHLLTGCNCLR